MEKAEQRAVCFQVALGRDCEQEEISRIPKHSPCGGSRGASWAGRRKLHPGEEQVSGVANFTK